MLNKLIMQIIKIVKENLIFFITFILLLILMHIQLPYYIETTGGIINLDDRVVVNNNYKVKGSLNMAYVSSLNGYISNIIYALFDKHTDIKPIKNEIGTSTKKETELRNKLALEDSIDSAIITAYKYSNKNIDILNKKIIVSYIFDEADTTLKVGDIITKINNTKINNKKEILNIISNLKENSNVKIEVLNNNKKYERNAKIINIDNKKVLGIMCYTDYEIKTNPNIKISFEKAESGPSGGLMLALSIYSKINNIDITNGLNIAGTGTIDEDGNVGEISGIKYKLKGAVNNNMDVFLVAKENYKEAIKEKKKNNYNIDIYSVSNFKEAISILKKLGNS